MRDREAFNATVRKALKKLRTRRRELGLCIDCAAPSPVYHRCEDCRKACRARDVRRRKRIKTLAGPSIPVKRPPKRESEEHVDLMVQLAFGGRRA